MSHAASPDSSSLERLLAERDWVARMAGSLIADPATADDVAQDTWLAAVEAPPADDAHPRAWLGTVLRRKIASWRRSAGRRSRNESAAARSEGTPSTAELAARAEVTERLARAVLALDEPYRATMLHRFVDDAPPREVARRMGVPVETVRTRTRRAIEQLRKALDPKEPERRRQFGFAIFALGEPYRAATAAATSLSIGTVAMLVGGVAATVAVVGVSVGWFASPKAPAPITVVRAQTEIESDLAARPKSSNPAKTGDLDSATGLRPPLIPAHWSIEGRVISETTNAGIPGATVKVSLVRGVRSDVLATVRSDEVGTFRADLDKLGRISRAGRSAATLFATARAAGHVVSNDGVRIENNELRKGPHVVRTTISMAPAFVARGRIVSERGTPVSAAVVARYADSVHEMSYSTSDENGQYEVRMWEVGAGFLLARAGGFGTGELIDLRWRDDRDVELPDVVLHGTGSIAGSVVSSTGRAIAGIAVWGESLEQRKGGASAQLGMTPGDDSFEVRTDENGRFRYTGLRPGPWSVGALRWPEPGRPGVVETKTDEGEASIVLKGHLLRVRMLDSEGEPVVGVGFDATCTDAPFSASLVSGPSDSLPVFLAPAGSHVVFAANAPDCKPIHETIVAGAGGDESVVTFTLEEAHDRGTLVITPKTTDGAVVGSAGFELTSELTGLKIPASELDLFEHDPIWSPDAAPIEISPGRYRLTFSPRGTGEDEIRTMFLPTKINVVIEAHKPTHVEIPCRKGGRVRFTIEGLPAGPFITESGVAVAVSGGERIEFRGWAQETDDGEQWGTGGMFWDPRRPIWPMQALPAGTHRMTVKFKNQTPVESIVTIEEGRFTDATVRVALK